MKFYQFLMVLLVLNLAACKNKKVIQEHPPGLDTLKPAVKSELPDEMIGDWEKCEMKGRKSIYTKVNLSNSLEIKTIIYDDPYCQMIDSTRESTVISFYYFEYEKGLLKTKVQSRKMVVFNPLEIEAMNKDITCGFSDWKARKPKEVLGTACLNLPRDNKYDLSSFSVSLNNKNLLLENFELTAYKKQAESETPKVISNTTNSKLATEPGDRSVQIIYPPLSERMLVQVTKDSHPLLRNCSKVLSNYQTSLSTRLKIKKLQNDITKEKVRLSSIQEEINTAITELVNYIEANSLQEYDRLSKDYEDVEEILSALQTEYKYCEINCPEVWSRLLEQRNKRTQINNDMIALRIPRKVSNNYYAYSNEVSQIETTHGQQKQLITSKEKVVKETIDTLADMFNEFESDTGVPATINFTGTWSKNLDTLVKANPGVKFRLAPLANLIMTYKILGIENYPGNTSIISFPVTVVSSLVKGRVKLKSYPEAMNGAGVISLLAACPAKNPQDYKLKLNQPGELEFEVFFEYKD